ncbi:acid protease [Dichomitus squalens]|uniref:Acid protease n=1 Tax=Dichomitus squalens TaxID=114155 RepID=A0A4Q9PT38_9APHY|nr:acid protease [Dichomitus squalens]TBU57603.1 acid protease [Dichomitus squalens]
MLSGLRLASVFLGVLSLGLDSDALVVRKSSPVTLQFARRFNFTGTSKILELDQARAKALKARALAHPGRLTRSAITNIDATNQAVEYTATVGVGTPPSDFTLLIDTGSSNTWVGATKQFEETSSTVNTGQLVEVVYGSGFVIGEEFTDTVTLAPGLAIEAQSIGVAIESSGFEGLDGILGIGPTDLTCGTLIPDESACIPTVTDNAFTQGLIGEGQVGVSFEPTTSLEVTNGELTFGGTDPSKFTGDLNFVPITSTAPANEFVGIDQTITYGSAGTTVLASTAGITDTGTTLLLIASDALATYQSLTGAVADENTGLLRLTPAQFADLQSLFFQIGDNTFEFTPNAQAWPRALNTAIGGTNEFVYLIVGDLGTDSGEGFDFVDGMTFLERFYYVFDSANSQVGFATTQFTNAETN